MPKTLVIVESPAKARTISRFLGSDYRVEASFGHVRDLPEKASDVPEKFKGKKWGKLGVDVEGDFEPVYIVTADKKRHVTNLKDAAKSVDRLLLATDEDREGESISWHILELLKPKKSVDVQRIVFHEITPEAIKEALANPRSVDEALVKAQETRRILDRLYGYTISPLLWKKVGPKLSAGRVQSVAVRLVVMRERERREFVVSDYSSVTAELQSKDGSLKGRLHAVGKQTVATGASFGSDGTLESPNTTRWLKQGDARSLAEGLREESPWTATKVETKPGVENPPVPFMTSTLQQEANRKLGFSARQTMQVAQQLYEGIDIGSGAVGLITYMRTDSLALADRAVKDIRQHVTESYGAEYLPDKPKVYKSKAKNAQEAHEAVRPTEVSRTPASIKNKLTRDQFALYDLIWKRTLACQMKPAQVERTRIETTVVYQGDDHLFVSSGKRIAFPGFLRVYVEGSDDPEAELGDKETVLPEVKQGEVLKALSVTSEDHQTRPPARYTEASLVKKLEQEGVGRPSTYASIIGTIQDRGYVFKASGSLVPTFTAFAVTELLENNFDTLVDLQFTAKMEEELDDIADGERDPVKHLRDFYYGIDGEPGIVEKVDKQGPNIPYPMIPLGNDVVVRIGRNGPFIQRGDGGPGNTASIPEDLAPADLTLEKAEELLAARKEGPVAVGTDPTTGRAVYHKKGRYCDYLEVEPEEGDDSTPKRVTLPPNFDPSSADAEHLALLLSYPRTIGKHPENGEDIVLALGRYGPYLTAGDKRANTGDWLESAKMDLDGAIKALEEGGTRGRSSKPEALKEFGKLDGVEGEVRLMSGRYGPYVTDGTTNATLPRGTDPDSLTPEQAVELIKAKAAAGPSKKRRVVRRKKK